MAWLGLEAGRSAVQVGEAGRDPGRGEKQVQMGQPRGRAEARGPQEGRGPWQVIRASVPRGLSGGSASSVP